MLLDLIILIIYDEDYKSLCYFLHPPATLNFQSLNNDTNHPQSYQSFRHNLCCKTMEFNHCFGKCNCRAEVQTTN
jgi:hypothetical protein